MIEKRSLRILKGKLFFRLLIAPIRFFEKILFGTIFHLVPKNKNKYQEVNLHIGIHKTATTYLQNQLKKAFHKDQEVYYLPLERLRSLRRKFGMKKLLLLPRNQKYAIFSDENIIGGLNQIPKEGVYKNNYRFLADCIQCIDSRKVNIFISIRSITRYLSSSYCEFLRHHEYISFKDFSKLVEIKDFSWHATFNQLIIESSDVHFLIFNFDNFSNIKNTLLKKISFDRCNSFDLNIPKSRESFTNGEINSFAGKQLFEDAHQKFDPFSLADHTIASENLKKDLDLFSRHNNVRVIDS